MESKHQKLLRKNLPYFCRNLNPQVLMAYLPCLSQPSQEEIEAVQNTRGKFQGMMKLHEHLICHPHAWNQLMEALRNPDLNLDHVANKLDPQPVQEEKGVKPTHCSNTDMSVVYSRRDTTALPVKSVSGGKVNGDTRWNDLNAGVREILKQLDCIQGSTDKLVGELGFLNKDFLDIIAHRAGNSLALALIDEWNIREEATLGKLMVAIRNIERLDILRELEKHTDFKLPDGTDEPVDEAEDGRPNDDARQVAANRKINAYLQNKPGEKPEDSVSSLVQLSPPMNLTGNHIVGQRQEDVPQVLEFSKMSDLEVDAYPGNEVPTGTRNMLLDRSLSRDLSTPVLNPFIIEGSFGQPEPLVVKESNSEPVQTMPESSFPAVENLRFGQLHCVHQESQGIGEFQMVNKNDLPAFEGNQLRWGGTQAQLEEREPLLEASQPGLSTGRDIPDGPRQQASWNGANSFLHGEIMTEYTNNVEIRIISADTVNNNGSTETLSYPSASNCISIMRPGRVIAPEECMVHVSDVNTIQNWGKGTIETNTDAIQGELMAVDDSLSSFDSFKSEASNQCQDPERSEEESLQSQVNINDFTSNNSTTSEVGSSKTDTGSQDRPNIQSTGELTGILRKALKGLPEPRAELYKDEVESGDSMTPSGHWLNSEDVDDEDLFGDLSTDFPEDGNIIPTPDFQNRGAGEMTNTVQKESNVDRDFQTSENPFPRHMDTRREAAMCGQSCMDSNTCVVGNSNNLQIDSEVCNENFTINLGLGETENDQSAGINESESSSTDQRGASVLETVFATAYSESDSLPWQQLISGVRGLTFLVRTLKQ